MLRQPPVKATFDTNTLSGVIDPDRQFGAADHMAYQAVHGALRMGQIRGLFQRATYSMRCQLSAAVFSQGTLTDHFNILIFR